MKSLWMLFAWILLFSESQAATFARMKPLVVTAEALWQKGMKYDCVAQVHSGGATGSGTLISYKGRQAILGPAHMVLDNRTFVCFSLPKTHPSSSLRDKYSAVACADVLPNFHSVSPVARSLVDMRLLFLDRTIPHAPAKLPPIKLKGSLTETLKAMTKAEREKGFCVGYTRHLPGQENQTASRKIAFQVGLQSESLHETVRNSPLYWYYLSQVCHHANFPTNFKAALQSSKPGDEALRESFMKEFSSFSLNPWIWSWFYSPQIPLGGEFHVSKGMSGGAVFDKDDYLTGVVRSHEVVEARSPVCGTVHASYACSILPWVPLILERLQNYPQGGPEYRSLL